MAAISLRLWSYQRLSVSTQHQRASLQDQLRAAQTALRAAPQLQYVAELSDGKADAMLVTIDRRHKELVLQRVSGFWEGEDKSAQLWELSSGVRWPYHTEGCDRGQGYGGKSTSRLGSHGRSCGGVHPFALPGLIACALASACAYASAIRARSVLSNSSGCSSTPRPRPTGLRVAVLRG